MVEFTPGPAVLLLPQGMPQVADLPPPDPAYPATVLSNLSHQPFTIKAGAAGTPGFNAPGSITLQGRESYLTFDPAFATNAQAVILKMDGIVVTGDSVLAADAIGAGVMFTRGTTRDVWMFTNPGTETI